MTRQNTFRDRKQDKRRPAVDMSTMVYGKVPPNAVKEEQQVLAAIMRDREAFDIVNELLKPEAFYVPAHETIFTVIRNMQKAGQATDELTVTMQLVKEGLLEEVGGPAFVTNLTIAFVSAINIEQHCLYILETFMARGMIKISGQTITEAYEGQDVFDIIGRAEKGITDLTSKTPKKTFTRIDVEVVHSLARIEALRNQNVDVTGVPSGFPVIDKVTFGWQPADLIILAARPAVGKTAFALNLVRNAALNPQKPTPVAFFSLEMSKEQLVDRIISAESGIWLEKIKRGKLEDAEYQKLHTQTAPFISGLPIYIDDTAALNVFELRAKARRLKNKHNIGLIIIDYLQLMSGVSDRGSNREQEISQISRNLKILAKELNIPIIALSQLSRAPEGRTGAAKMPQLSDLRESGAIEQDADMVIFMYRPDYYDQNTNEHGDSTKGETHIRIAKHRNGSLETIKLRALLHIQKFIEMEDMNLPSGLPTGQGQKWAPVRTNFYETDRDDQPF